MRICVSGTSSQGKSTFISDFLKEWPQFKTPKNTYREFVEDNHSKKANKDTQWKILNSMVDELQKHHKGDYVIYDRGPLDNMVHTIWCNSKNSGGIDDEFVQKCMKIVAESVKHLDIIFFIPITNVATVEYDNDEFQADKEAGLTDEEHREEIDCLFKALKCDWDTNPKCKFCDPQDRPAIIEVFIKGKMILVKVSVNDFPIV